MSLFGRLTMWTTTRFFESNLSWMQPWYSTMIIIRVVTLSFDSGQKLNVGCKNDWHKNQRKAMQCLYSKDDCAYLMPIQI